MCGDRAAAAFIIVDRDAFGVQLSALNASLRRKPLADRDCELSTER
jgi:hypothetical protein